MRPILGLAGAASLYALAALALFYRPGLFDGTAIFGFGTDPLLYVWVFKFLPAAIAHGQNPFILPLAWAPYGLNITQATTTPLPALLAWPLTAWRGPVAAFAIVSLFAPVLAAMPAFVLNWQLTGKWFPAFIGGWIFGFSTAVFAPMTGHLQTDFVAFIPLSFLALLMRMNGRLSFRGLVAMLSLAGICQFLTSLEIYVTTAIILTIFATAVHIIRAGGIGAMVRGPAEHLLPGLVLSWVITLIVTSPFTYYFFQNYDEIPHLLQNGDYYFVDLLNFIIPTFFTWLGGDLCRPVTALFTGNVSEQLGYIGLPLVVITAIAARGLWRDAIAKPIIITLMITLVLALGPYLKIAGIRIIPLPWILLERLPLLVNALPARLMAFVMLMIGMLCALWLSRIERHHVLACFGVLAAALLMLPNSHDAHFYKYWYRPLKIPVLFQNAGYKTYIPPGQTVLFLPFNAFGGDPLLWQALSDGYFRTVNGYGNFVPPPLNQGPGADILQSAANPVPADIVQIRQFNGFMNSTGARYVIMRQNAVAKWDQFLQAAGWRRRDVDDMAIYSRP